MDKHKFVGTIVDISSINAEDVLWYDGGEVRSSPRVRIKIGKETFNYDGYFEWGQFIFIPAGVLT